jgi:hypothetical protein
MLTRTAGASGDIPLQMALHYLNTVVAEGWFGHSWDV